MTKKKTLEEKIHNAVLNILAKPDYTCSPAGSYILTPLVKLVEKEIDKARDEEHDRVEEWFAYCSCGDSMDRTGLYPNEAKYYCFGCDKYYQLIESKPDK